MGNNNSRIVRRMPIARRRFNDLTWLRTLTHPTRIDLAFGGEAVQDVCFEVGHSAEVLKRVGNFDLIYQESTTQDNSDLRNGFAEVEIPRVHSASTS